MGREWFLPRCNLLRDLGQSSSALVPQFPTLGQIWVVCGLMTHFTTCIVIPCDMGEVSIEITRLVPITYQEPPCWWHHSCWGTARHPWPSSKSQGWMLDISAFFQQREGKAGSSPSQWYECWEGHLEIGCAKSYQSPPQQVPEEWGSPSHSITPGLLVHCDLVDHLCQAHGDEPPSHQGPEGQTRCL